MEQDSITQELLQSGNSLWSSVECDVMRDYVVVYARLHTTAPQGIEGALAESERVFELVLGRHLAGHNWLAAVHWSDRLCRTFTSRARRNDNTAQM
jgi:hypothetical protein